MKKSYLLVLSLIAFGFLQAQENITSIKNDVSFLAHDSLNGREMGTEGERIAAAYIAERMKALGLKGKGGNGENGFMQDFSVTPKANPHATEPQADGVPIKGMNVIGYKDNGAEYTVVIGAHFDHLGTGSEGSLHVAKDGQIHNGADDNASGVALMLAMAESLSKEGYNKGHNYLFMAFSGEEKGLWGSNYYCKNPTIDLKKVSFMINFDMVGRLDTARGLAISGVGTSPVWKDKIAAAQC